MNIHRNQLHRYQLEWDQFNNFFQIEFIGVVKMI